MGIVIAFPADRCSVGSGLIEPSDDDAAVMSELSRLVPANQLDVRYRIDV